MLSKFRSKLLGTAVALSMGVLLYGCSGSSNSPEIPPPAATMVEIAPSLGKFSKDTKVSLKKADGSLIKDGLIGDNGKATIDVGSHVGPLVVEIEGGANVKYFDEGKKDYVTFPAGRKLKAVAHAVTSTIGVTPLTHAAAERMGNNPSEAVIRQENAQIATQFGLSNILAQPVLIGSTDDKVATTDGDAGKYALLLAGFAKAAEAADFTTHDAVAALAEDLKDGKLDGKNADAPIEKALSSTQIAEKLDLAADTFAKEADKSFLKEQIADLKIEDDTPILTDKEVEAITSAGTDLDQAKKLFSDLRAGILPYANEAESGFLDGEGRKLEEEVNALTENTANGLEGVVDLGAEVWEYLEGESTCSANTPAAATCYIEFGRVNLPVAISNDTTTRVVSYTVNNSSALTGTIAYTMNGSKVASITINGTVPGMTQNTRSTVENLAVTRTASGNDMYRYTLGGKLTDKRISDQVAVLSLQFDSGSVVDAHEPANINDDNDLEKFVFDVTGIFSTANYSFKGRFEARNWVEKEFQKTNQYCWFNYSTNVWQSCSWNSDEVVSGNATFTGTISGNGLVDTDANNNFDILVGKLEAIMKDDNSYNPALPDSATNFLTGSMTFTGTTFMTATDTGLKIVLGVSATGHEKGTVSVNYYDFKKGISITGTTNWDDAITTPQTITLTDANGIKIVLVEDVDNAEVKKGEVKLADIAGSMINYIDGTSASLY